MTTGTPASLSPAVASASGAGRGKILLFGEHAVVFGHPALGVALPFGTTVTASREVSTSTSASDSTTQPTSPSISTIRLVGETVPSDPRLDAALQELASAFEAGAVTLRVSSRLPLGGGLGSSAAFSVAACRAVAALTGRTLSAAELDTLSFRMEQAFHGRPSGVDSALASRSGVWRFVRGESDGTAPQLQSVRLSRPLALVIGHTGIPRGTHAPVASVAAQREADPHGVGRRLRRLGELSDFGRAHLESGDGSALGAAMDEAHALLSQLGVSCAELEALVGAARAAGAWGAKLTGAGGGGAAIAVGPDPHALVAAMEQAGFASQTVWIDHRSTDPR